MIDIISNKTVRAKNRINVGGVKGRLRSARRTANKFAKRMKYTHSIPAKNAILFITL